MRTWVGLVSLCAAWAGTAHGSEPRPAVVPYDEARFVPLDPKRPEGPRIAVLWGDPQAGPSAMLMRFGRGGGRLHLHTADYDLVVLEGSVKHWPEGESEAGAPLLGRGSYWHQPGGQAHADACMVDECTVFLRWSGPHDARLAKTPESER
jgi:hypothetical protein